MTRTIAAGALAVFCAGCSVEGTDPGELGNGAFTYSCAGATDAWCETPFRHGGRPLPAIAAPFAVTYDDTAIGSAQIVSASPSRLALSRGRFAFLAPGPAALLARDSTGIVRDFFHLAGSPIAGIELVRIRPGQLEGAAPSQQLAVDPWSIEPLVVLAMRAGETATLFGYPVADSGDVLTGSATWSFAIEPAGVAALHGVEGDNVIAVEALAPGEATLRVRAGNAERVVAMHVEVGP